MSPGRQPRLLVFVIAYYAEATLQSVLERIPRTLLDEYICEILVVDDASEDRTAAIGREYQQAHPEIRITVLRNEYNQGYGGNQKVGYAFAIREGFDFVAMVHGDGQYAPEELPKLVAPLRDRTADAVFGSRMLTRLGALRGGMPLYKFVGNRILTGMQNLLLGTSLSEFHSGYRVYSVAALKRIAFQLNSNAFQFDTEIIIQLLNAGQRIVELPIPTYYGHEISRVNGMKYAKDVTVATLQNVAHRAGLLYQRRFEPVSEFGNAHYDMKLGYASSHQLALDAVPAGATAIDFGSGPGEFARALVSKGCTVAVVDRAFPQSLADLGVEVFQQDLDDEPTFDVRRYQYLMMLDVIEHLKEPERFIERIRAQFDYSPATLVLTTPNVAFLVPACDADGRSVQLRQGRYSRPHPHPTVYVPLIAAAPSRCRLSNQRDPRHSGALSESAGRRRGRKDGARRQRAPDPCQQDAVLLPDLRGCRGHAGRGLRSSGLEGAQHCGVLGLGPGTNQP